ncbi:WGR domain-containing protein [Bradyrhizobium sp. Cp5.3]|uniref:WGR domain-containing protein n=1 Tax=Bradyrhizobium sp. Cp5.3 TaxID=443598 RepID=UPI000400BE7D|nr:WGR domain-containing protein [Bradyrhizobium sp. Cp5.3]
MPNLKLGPLCLAASLICNWGRIGTTGQTMVQTFDASAKAGEAFVRLERAKRRRGYTSVEEKV